MDKQYPDYILKKLRQMHDLEENDTSKDEMLLKMNPNRVFKEICEWEGLLGGWDSQIKGWISSIYKIDLDAKTNV